MWFYMETKRAIIVCCSRSLGVQIFKCDLFTTNDQGHVDSNDVNFICAMKLISLLLSSQVVDMTGREAKVLTGYGSFATQHANPEEESSGIVQYSTLISMCG